MDFMKNMKDEKGFVLVLAIIIMAAMTAIGLAVVTTSTTDVMIARNEMESKKAFYLAQSGLEEAIGRMNVLSSNARFVGEDSGQKAYRKTGTCVGLCPNPSYDGQTFFSHSGANALSPAGLGGTYEVRVDYAREAAATWCNDGGVCTGTETHVTTPTDEEIVLYCKEGAGNFGFVGGGAMTNCSGAQPVYKVTSTGTTSTGTAATIVAYVASSSLNVVPPGNTILFTEGAIAIGGGGSINGAVASFENTIVGTCAGVCVDESVATIPLWTAGGMQDYIGVDIAELKNMADYPSPYDQSLANDNYNPGGEWGTVCDDAGDGSAADIDTHICDNEAKIIYIDNVGKNATLAANSTGRGILVVTGDLSTAGNLLWEGMIYIMGELRTTGSVTIYGTLMIDGDNDDDDDDDVYVNGALDIFGSVEVASSVGDIVGGPKILRWYRE